MVEITLLILLLVFLVTGFIGYVIGRNQKSLNENQGEGLTRRVLAKTFNSPEYHLLNNLTLPTDDGTTQVDHILVSRYGVFIIETKHYKGWIFGEEKSKKWTQVIYKKKSQFQNPLRQNYKHKKTIEKILEFLPETSIHAVVVFTGDAEFKKTKPKNVYSLSELVKYIKSQQNEVLSQNRVAFSVGRLECERYQMSGKTDYEHQSHLLEKYGDIT